MSFSELKAFDAVARFGGFVRAAEQLNRAQPTVTAQVRNLERRYGVELFFRNRGQLARMTPLGEKLFETTRQMFSLEEDAKALVAAAGKMKGGVLRLGAISPRWATGVMAGIMATYPALDLSLVIDNSQNLLDQILDYRIDVAFIGAHVRDPLCYMRLVSRPEIAFVVAQDHPLAEKGAVTQEQFSRSTLIHREPGSETRALIDAAINENGYHAARVVVFGNRDGSMTAAEQGLGLAPTSIEEIPGGANVSVVRAADFVTHGEIHAICLKARRHLPIISETFDILHSLIDADSGKK